MRKLFIKEILRLSENKDIYLIINDLGFNVVEPFKKKFPKKFYNAGVSEQNMMGMSAGLASESCHVFAYSIANFSTFRCAEQIRNDIDYHNLPVTIVSVGSGLGYGNLGYTHHALQDYSLMRSFPNILIMSPGNNNELIGSLNYIAQNPQPSYLRLDKDEIIEKDEKKKNRKILPGKLVEIIRGSKKKAIIVTGNVQNIATKIRDKKFKDYSIYSLPIWGMKVKKYFYNQIKNFKKIITFEDHFYDGGFASWINEIIVVENSKINIKPNYVSTNSINDVGSKDYLFKKYGPKI